MKNKLKSQVGKGKRLGHLTTKDIIERINQNGEFRIAIFSESHDKYENNISHIPKYSGALNRGSIVIKEVKGMNDAKGIHYWSAWFVNNSPFGKMFRHVGKHRDPWTQEILTGDEKIAMTLEGVTDLLTLGTKLGAAVINQGLNIIFQILEKMEVNPIILSGIGIVILIHI